MAVESQYSDSARARNPEHFGPRLTPGTQPWAAAVVRDLRAGFGAEDIALRLGCDPQHIREKLAKLRRLGLLSQLYAQAREEWRP